MRVRETLRTCWLGLREGEIRAMLFSVGLAALVVAAIIAFADARMRTRVLGDDWRCVDLPYGPVCHKDVTAKPSEASRP